MDGEVGHCNKSAGQSPAGNQDKNGKRYYLFNKPSTVMAT